MPEENCAIFRAGRNVAVRRDVAFRSSKASHDAVVTENDLKKTFWVHFHLQQKLHKRSITVDSYEKSDTFGKLLLYLISK